MASQTYQKVVAGKGLAGQTLTWHRLVLAEFVSCIVIVGASPILTPRNPNRTDPQPVSLAGPLVRLTAVCVLFFVLALMATGPKAGKVAAAFGLLVVLGALLNATDEISILGKALMVSGGQPEEAEGGGGGLAEGGGGPVLGGGGQ